MNEIYLGRKPDNNIIIDNPKVGRKHAKLVRLSGNNFLIVDLDSTNGTFVNGRRVKKIKVTINDNIKLADTDIDLSLIIKKIDADGIVKSIHYKELLEINDIANKFLELENVYEKYKADKKKIMKAQTMKRSGIRALFLLIPWIGNAIAALVSPQVDNKQKLEDLNEEFKKNYVCPKCYSFLGFEPFENLKRRGYCKVCKTKWL